MPVSSPTVSRSPTHILPVLALVTGAGPIVAQSSDTLPPPFPLPAAVPWEEVRSLGQPSPWNPYLTFGVGLGREDGHEVTRIGAGAGVYRNLTPPLDGLLGWQGEGWAGAADGELDGAARLLLRSPRYLVGAGLGYDFRRERFGPVVSLRVPPVRGGLLGRGGEVRLDWLGDAEAVQLGVQFPLGKSRAGRTRPAEVAVALPRPARPPVRHPSTPGDPAAGALAELAEAAEVVSRLSTFLFEASSDPDGVSAAVARLRSDLLLRDPSRAGRPPHERELLTYHAALERAFGGGAGAGESAEEGKALADAARQAVLEEVFLPFNRTVGRYKSPDTLRGLVARARARFAGWLAGRPLEGGNALAIFDGWMAEVEELRRARGRQVGDARREWLPMGLVLRPEQHRTQAQLDAILAGAVGEPLPGGNAVLYFPTQQFPVELSRTIQEAESWHLLWVDAFEGLDRAGEPDRIGFYQAALGYLAALTRRVRDYDRTGRLPTYLLLLDQAGYEARGSRLWLDLLERPLDHRMRLPERHAAMAGVIAAWQDSLRQAVAGSRRLAGEAAAQGGDWVRARVKVHVSVLNPADFSFRTRRLPGFPTGSDNQLRDRHRLVLRDVTEADPAAGELLVSGAGVGDRFTSTAWEDRVLLVTGPAAAAGKRAAREVLLRNGMAPRDLPAPLREVPPAPDRADRIAALADSGATARVLLAHDRTGWGEKDAAFLQLLLWDLAPPGTAIYVADDHWSEPLWAAQLLGAALRGCEVYLVAPSTANAPAASGPTMPATRRLLTTLAAVQDDLGDVIRNGGGDFRVGLYTRKSPIGLPEAKLWEVDTTYGKYAFLRTQFPFPEATWRMLWEHRARMDSLAAGREPPTDEPGGRIPRLHRRTQFLGSRALLDRLALQPESHGALDLEMREWSEGRTVTPEPGPIPAQRRMEVARELMRGWDALPEGLRDSTLLYLGVGTGARDTRSLAYDGGATALVSGRWSLVAWLDFWALFGSTTWIERVEEVTELIPPRD